MTVTGTDLVQTWRHGLHDDGRKTCPGCGWDCMRTAIVDVAYVFDVCSCGDPVYDHLVEQLWHRACLSGERYPRPAAPPPFEPARDIPPPDGYRLVWRRDDGIDGDWVVGNYGQCRMLTRGVRCPDDGVAALRRGRTRRLWAYCGGHLYGRILHDDAIWCVVVEPVSSTESA